jgi:hypothetical protein
VEEVHKRCRNIGPGIEFVVTYASEPVLYVIKRQLRENAQVATQQAFYYVLFGNIYQAPSLHACLTSRCARCLHLVDSAFGQLKHDLEPLSWQEKRRNKRIERAADEAASHPDAMGCTTLSGEANPPCHLVVFFCRRWCAWECCSTRGSALTRRFLRNNFLPFESMHPCLQSLGPVAPRQVSHLLLYRMVALNGRKPLVQMAQ